MNILGPLFKELFEPPQPAPKPKKPPKKKPRPVQEGESVNVAPKVDEPKMPEIKQEPKVKTVAGVPITPTTLRQGIIMSEVLGKPVCKRK